MKRCRNTTAFTLIELLSVIAVIAILAALLFPTLNSAREKGNTTKCLANMGQWGVAITAYMGDSGSRGFFPEEGSDGTGNIIINASNAWFNVLASYVGEEGLYSRMSPPKPRKQPRPRDGSLFTCPSATEKELHDFEGAGGVKMTGTELTVPYLCYSYNVWIDHEQRAKDNPSGKTGFGKLLRLSQLTKPSKFVVFSETAGNKGNCWPYYLSYRHPGGSVNMCFADGRAATFTSNNIYTTGKSQNRGGIIWDPEGDPLQSDPSF
jgi:prepilin-type N-terminal cleavage/methylation domain-containing protein/prepilin-type processing-associated H-X9-DG protein